jgi:phosphoribulokinase
MPDYMHYICPQFTETDVNFQRVPTVDTSQPVHRALTSRRRTSAGGDPLLQTPRGIDFPYLLNMIDDSASCRGRIPSSCRATRSSWRCSLIFTPFIWRMMERRKRALGTL